MGTARAEQLRKRLAQGLAARPILRGALRALGAGCFCFVLAGAGLLSEHVPLALAPVCVRRLGRRLCARISEPRQATPCSGDCPPHWSRSRQDF